MTPENRFKEAAKQARIASEYHSDEDHIADAEALAEAAAWMAGRVEG